MRILVDDENYAEETRLDVFLADQIDEYSRSKLQTLIKSKDVLVNGKAEKASYIIGPDDEIFIDLKKLEPKKILAEDIDLDIVYRDEDIAIVNKPTHMLSHPTFKRRTNTLVNALLFHFDKLSDLNGEDRPGIVHRLDYNTSGLMVVALNNQAHKNLKEMFKQRKIVKKYRAIVNGNFTEESGLIEGPIGRNPYNRKLMTVVEGGRYAKTSYRVLDQVEGFSYLDIDLYTGRTHQIRVHLSHINRPIVGDPDYNHIKNNFNLDCQLLQAYYLEFDHPSSKKRLSFEIGESPLIEKYRKIIFNRK